MTTIQKTTTGTIQEAGGAKGCGQGVGKPPPQPTIAVSIATEGLAKTPEHFQPTSPPNAPRVPRPDPAYIEIHNWEPGTTFQLINKSANPKASFDNPGDIIALEPTGRDVQGRIASIWIDEEDMQKYKLESGHSYRIRAIDADGMVSPDSLGRLQGTSYQRGQAGQVYEKDRWLPATQIQLLDGENARASFVLKHMADLSAPDVSHFRKEAKIVKNAEGKLELRSDGTLEDEATVHVMLGRTGAAFQGAVSADQKFALPLEGLAHHDTLIVTVRDRNGNAAQEFEIRYAENCKDGRASELGILDVRLKPVIGRPKAKAANG